MNWIDLALVLLLIVPVAVGLRIGLVRTAAGLAMIQGLVFGLHDYRSASLKLRPRMLQTPIAEFVVSAMLTPLGRSTELIWLNRAIGVFGVARYGCGPPIDGVLAELS